MAHRPDTGERLAAAIARLMAEEALPDGYRATVDGVCLPLASDLAARAQGRHSPLVVGICGAQGTGKSTLVRFLAEILTTGHNLPCVALSLDDIYLTKAQRRALATSVHPLLAVRGVPGTHDIDLGLRVLDALAAAGDEDVTQIPSFDKAADDRRPVRAWPGFRGRPRVILVEGWCVGARAQCESALRKPLNALERLRDQDGAWRRYVNSRLAGDYQRLFSRLDVLIQLQLPSWDLVPRWRQLQEDKLRARCNAEGATAPDLMSPAELATFIEHYERITRHCLAEMPERADCLVAVEADHGLSIVRALGDGMP